jgi:capsule polysaccharide export protein KpsE/RkpR
VYTVKQNSYSIESRTEQLLQLFESNSIRDSLIEKFDLATSYDIDTNAVGWKFALYNEFKDRVDIGKTRYESVRIEVLDEEPVRAQGLLLEMLEQINLLARRLQREKSAELLRMAERSMRHEQSKMDSIESRLSVIRQESGLLEYDLQTEELTKGYVKALSRAGTTEKEKEELKAMLSELETKGGEFRALTHLGNLSRTEYNDLVLEYEELMDDMSKELTYTNVIIHPEVPDKKVYPVRWLIVSISLVSALFFTFIVVAMKEYYGKE